MKIKQQSPVPHDGKEYLVFEVAGLKEPDQYGKTPHSDITKKVPAPKPGKQKSQTQRKRLSGLFLRVSTIINL
jgi:hypothetical protein